MKKFTLLFTVLFAAFVINAQNVAINNDGSTAATSAMLDVKSSSKGLLIPRMNSADRSAIVLPALGLLVFDTDTKTIWAYDGASWKNLTTSGGGGGFTLPFSQTVNTANSAFQITNQGAGAAIEGSSSAQFGIGMTAKATGEGSWGLFAFSNGAGSQSIRSFADNGTAFHGENNNPTNTNTLMSLINKGQGKTVTVQLANTSNYSPNMQIAGNNMAEQLKIYQTNALNWKPAVSIENSGTGAGVYSTSNTGIGIWGKSAEDVGIIGESNSNYGVKGITNTATGFAGVYGQNTGTAGSGVIGVSHAANTQGVYGNSNNGVGVRALTDNYRAVQAVANSGTALHSSSTTGYALETNGKIKIAGGNTNPSAGAVLTSDAIGNATWQQPATTPNVAFRVKGIIDGFAELPVNTGVKLQFKTQEYDLSGNFISINENGNLEEASVFYAPFNGIYHFSLSVGFFYKRNSAVDFYDYESANASFVIIRNGVELAPYSAMFEDNNPGFTAQVNGSTDFMLQAGDKVYVNAGQITYDLITAEVNMPIDNRDFLTFFSGYLVKKL